MDDEGSIVQATLTDVENSDFCVSGPSYGQAKQGLSLKTLNFGLKLENTVYGLIETLAFFLKPIYSYLDDSVC